MRFTLPQGLLGPLAFGNLIGVGVEVSGPWDRGQGHREDLLAALNDGRIEYATLDVFHEEPLPAAHPFWEHPRVLVTPHVASLIDPVAGGAAIAANLRRFINGEPVPNLVDLKQGY